MGTKVIRMIAVVLGTLFAGLGSASALDSPKTEPILVVDGDITETNSPSGATFDLAMLDALPQHKFTTGYHFTKGTAEYSGVLLKDLAAAVGAKGRVAEVRALNDYKADVPMSDTEIVPVLLATRIDGAPMRVRDKGPTWLVYDTRKRPEMNNPTTDAKMVWQITRITFK
ncbi:oxidoreductase [Arenibaculum pallidiluteum]|uniref:oxidoreductase n=1 Tax=Arenibaculum pallidiluteum TaxID=2812559 RepID=UPI001A9664C6|nr:oxidoreductase [Arenibaculum pallidiluteum]